MSAFAYAESVFLKALDQKIPAHERKRGILLGLSGGADSMLLLHLLHRLSQKEHFSLLALHVNHGIRGTEADRDEVFARAEAEKLSVPFEAVRVNVPLVSELEDMGIEETARRLRYEMFAMHAKKHGLTYVFTAHHATDHAETVLLHLARGTGLRGLCGIPEMRTLNGCVVFRPLLRLTGEEVQCAVKEASIPFVTDSTNADTSYKRNFVRNELLPRMRKLNPSFETAVIRMKDNVSQDMDCLDRLAYDSFLQMQKGDKIEKDALWALHPAIRYRVFQLFYRHNCPNAPLPERVHVEAFFDRLARGGNFTLDFPAGIRVGSFENNVMFVSHAPSKYALGQISLHMGENVLPDGGRIFLLPKNSRELPSNIHKISIHRDFSSATIDGELYVRSKADGDSYRYGGVTHKLKKLFSDAKIPLSERDHIPVVCDSAGILWVPHFGVREDGGEKDKRDMTFIYIKRNDEAMI